MPLNTKGPYGVRRGEIIRANCTYGSATEEGRTYVVNWLFRSVGWNYVRILGDDNRGHDIIANHFSKVKRRG